MEKTQIYDNPLIEVLNDQSGKVINFIFAIFPKELSKKIIRNSALLNLIEFKNNALIESLIFYFPEETKQIFDFFDYMLDEIKTNDQFSVRESSMLNQVNDWLTSIISSDNLEIFKFIFENYPSLFTENLPICKKTVAVEL